MAETLVSAFMVLIVTMDPLGNVPIFLALSRPLDERRRRRVAAQAVLVAFGLIAGFALAGAQLLRYLGVSIDSLSIAGGLLLILVALELLRGDERPPDRAGHEDIALVPLATPLLAGPGAIAATIVLVRQSEDGSDLAAVWIGIVAAFAVVWVVLRLAASIGRLLSERVIRLLSRVMGVLLAAIAVELVMGGIQGWIDSHGGL